MANYVWAYFLWVAGGAVHNLKLWTPFTILWTPFTIFVNAVHKILRIFFKNKNSKKFLQVKNLAVSITFGPSKRWAPHPSVFYCKNCTRNKSKAERGTREVFGLFRVLRLKMTLISKICCQKVGLTLLQGVFIKNKASKKILIFLFFFENSGGAVHNFCRIVNGVHKIVNGVHNCERLRPTSSYCHFR